MFIEKFATSTKLMSAAGYFIDAHIVEASGTKFRLGTKDTNSAAFRKRISVLPEPLCSVQTAEDIYLAFHDIERPKCKCGKDVSFQTFSKGYLTFCSSKCAGIFSRSKVVATYRQRTGFDSPLQNPHILAKVVASPRKRSRHLGSEEIKAKIRNTFQLRYGGHPSSVKEVKNKRRYTHLEKYGVEYPAQRTESQEARERTCLDKYGFLHPARAKAAKNWKDCVLPEFSQHGISCDEEWKHQKAEYFFTHSCGATFYDTLGYKYIPRCPKCFPRFISTGEKEVKDFVESLGLKTEVFKNLVTAEGRPKHIDIFIPEKKIGIEFNGVYFHQYDEKTSRKEKTDAAKMQGINLIHIWDIEWERKRELVENRLKAILGCFDKRIPARSCDIVEISTKEAAVFINQFHLQGYARSKIKLGIRLDNNLIGVATFGKPRFTKDFDWELIRIAFLPGVQIIGGLSKLLKFFSYKYSSSLLTYADIRFTPTPAAYQKAGFQIIKQSSPDYFYWKNKQVISRYEAQKSKIYELIGEKFDSSKSEHDNMIGAGWHRCNNVGNWVLSYNLPNKGNQ